MWLRLSAVRIAIRKTACIPVLRRKYDGSLKSRGGIFIVPACIGFGVAFFPAYTVCYHGNSSVSGYVACRAETVHGYVERYHKCACGFVESEHAL